MQLVVNSPFEYPAKCTNAHTHTSNVTCQLHSLFKFIVVKCRLSVSILYEIS